MDEKEKIKFLKQMGLSSSKFVPSEKKKTRQDNRIDKSDLLNLAKTFGLLPDSKVDDNVSLSEDASN